MIDDLPLVNQRGLLVAEVNLQPQTISVFDYGADCGVDDLIIEADLDVIAYFVSRLVVILGWHSVGMYRRMLRAATSAWCP